MRLIDRLRRATRLLSRSSPTAPVGEQNKGHPLYVEAYRQADALLFPSRIEGLPLTVIEAMACGLPVIAAKSASLPEVVAHGATGLLCPVDDVGAYVSAPRTLAGDAAGGA
ncbi:MAG: glycosyltransferase [Thiobacillaceae bacterium]